MSFQFNSAEIERVIEIGFEFFSDEIGIKFENVIKMCF